MNPQTHVDFYRDQDAVILSEVLEFALSLAPPVKGQETFSGLPHLQAYKLVRAATLAELGHVKVASR
jgi:COPII coat assembly protein SEC16